ncbi:TlpA family protein disulfide reductase [Candidatus Poribacteria bacterium]|jgi:thiol-disulfide isomerase/thioredoxin|nr:TlpA family protein disulfide reductase [Candidatus Poribacteria bacterium]MBT5532868.1 TlpA family protein disulfide reductase [Candidatus Poribacteria bacterium]MBT5709873.1 TlpA family protein disulfide reductase [Candidatus Poribacteria bacterium]MBT7804543.1 TlpA family protein disulfide reductase [Candidatus Poribacteria bacterium]
MKSRRVRRVVASLALCVAVTASARELAPAFTLSTFDGDPVSLSELRGKVVLLNFWASWCPPCKREIPLLIELHERALPGLAIVGIDTYDEWEEGRLGATELGIPYTVLFDREGAIAKAYGAFGIPTNVVIDATGRVHSSHLGFLTEEKFRATVEQAVSDVLAETPRAVDGSGKLATTWGRLRRTGRE